MTLDELLALLPDNTTGEIDAADLRTIVTELWNAIDALAATVAAQEEAAPTATVSTAWKLEAVAGATPTAGEISAAPSFATATSLRFSKTTSSGVDASASLLAATAVYLQEQSVASNFVSYTVTGATDTGISIDLAVTVKSSGGSLPLEVAPQTDALAVITVPRS